MASSRRVQPARSCRQQPRQQPQQRPSWAMTMGEMKAHVATNADDQGNLWCHLEGCRGTYTPYRVNVYGLRKTATNREEGHQMVPQQVQNVLRHLKEVHGIEKHLVTEALLPKGTPPFPEFDELMALRARVAHLQRDVEGLEAIVHNLDNQKREVTRQVYFLYLETAREQPFVQTDPPEDELPEITELRDALHKRENLLSSQLQQLQQQQPEEETGEEGEEEEKGDDDSDLDWGNQYSPPPASDDDDQSEGTTHHTALGGDQEEEEEEEQSPSSSQPPSSSQSTNYSDMADLLMDLTAPGPSHIQTRKRQLEAEEDQVPEEFQPLTVSTPNDPQGNSNIAPAKRCRLALMKRPAYEPATNPPPQKRPPVEEEDATSIPLDEEEDLAGDEEEDLGINISLTDEEERLNLVMAALPPTSPRTRLWTPAPPRPPRFPHPPPPSSSFLNREVLRWVKEPPTPHIRPQ